MKFLTEARLPELEPLRRDANATELQQAPALVVGAIVRGLNPDRPILHPHIRPSPQPPRERHRVERVLRGRIPDDIVFGEVGSVECGCEREAQEECCFSQSLGWDSTWAGCSKDAAKDHLPGSTVKTT